MIQRVGACILGSLFAVGCGVGDDGGGIPENKNPNGLVCTDAGTITGTFTAGTPVQPPDVSGCWPVGTWTFTVALDPADDNVLDITGDDQPDRCGRVSGTNAAVFDASYSFVVNRTMTEDGWDESYVLTGAVQDGERYKWNDKLLYRLKVSEGGGGDCEGGLELYSLDGKSYWNLKPSQLGAVLSGVAEFALYEESQN
jgi:hypothetical protein